ncbi:MAG: VWA domain-containing protein [Anaerolineaceae bacterium]|nr:VWA domain-containing protein [Anaerolineaceae bacterium]
MAYNVLATSQTPALIIYLLDVSGSMSTNLNGKPRIEVVTDALAATLQQMVFRCTKGGQISPRYRIAMYAYSDSVYDILGGVMTIDQIANLGVPELSTMRSTATDLAFEEVERLLQQELPSLNDCPAPLVCHMTDGEYTGEDPEPIVRRIMRMSNADGNVLVENIFISDQLLDQPVNDIANWQGVLPTTHLRNGYAKKLRSISSPLPQSYRVMMLESGYTLSPDAVMMLPGMSTELVEMGFVMSMSTPVAQ